MTSPLGRAKRLPAYQAKRNVTTCHKDKHAHDKMTHLHWHDVRQSRRHCRRLVPTGVEHEQKGGFRHDFLKANHLHSIWAYLQQHIVGEGGRLQEQIEVMAVEPGPKAQPRTVSRKLHAAGDLLQRQTTFENVDDSQMARK